MPSNTERGYILETAAMRRAGGHRQNRFRVRCECGYPLYLEYRGGRRTCTSCRRVWAITAHGSGSDDASSFRVRMELRGRRGEAIARTRRPRSAAARAHSEAVARLFPELSREGRAFGVELEMTGLSRSDAARALNGAGIPATVEGYNHSLRDHWKVVTDASVPGGCEVVSPKLRGEAGFAELYKVCEALTNAGASVRRTCGLHVHVDARDISERAYANFFRAYAHFENAIDAFMPRSRRGDSASYARSMNRANGALASAETRREVRSAIACGSSHARFHKVNPESFARHGTIEVRHHSGTVEWGKTSNWAKLLLAMLDASASERALPASNGLAELLEWSGAESDVAMFYRMRTAHFADEARRARA